VLFPLVAFLLQRLVLAAVALVSGHDPLAPSSYVRWDSVFYLDIAARGYAPLVPCPPESHYPATAWCGNAGWFPGFPWLLKPAALLGLSLPASAISLGATAQLGCLVLFWRCLDDERQWPALGAAAFFLGNVYVAAVFPTSLFLLAALACLAACWSRRFPLAGIAGAVAAACYPTGVLLAPVILVWSLRHRVRGAVWAIAGVLVGLAVVLAVMQSEAGSWTAYFQIQAKYGYRPSLGIDALFSRLKPLVNPRYWSAKGFVTAVQTLLALALVTSLCVRWRRLRSSPRDALLVVYTVAFWVGPLTLGGNLSLHRSEALLLPAALLLPVFPRTVQTVALTAAILLSIPMALLFFQGVLV
jgi:Glycosyltransferase family 87